MRGLPQPERLVPRLLRDALLSTPAPLPPAPPAAVRVVLGGVSLRLHDPHGLGAEVWAAWAPYCGCDREGGAEGSAEGSAEGEWTLTLEPLPALPAGGAPPSAPPSYTRADLRVWLDAERRAARAEVDGSWGAAEACAQVTLQRALRAAGGLLVHASAAVERDAAGGERGWLIPGASGAGKSTAAREGGFARVLTDELVALLLRADGGVDLYPTPFWSEGRDPTRFPLQTRPAPLALIALPRKDARPRLSPVGAAEAARALLRCVVSYEEGREAHAALLELCCEVAERAPCAALHFPKRGPWLSALR